MLLSFHEDGKYNFGKDLALGIAERKRLNIEILNELSIPHVNGWLSVELRLLRNVDLTCNKEKLSKMQEALQENFLYILGLPGLIRKVCYEAGYVEAVLKFRDDVGAECFKSIFGGCAAKRIQENGYVEAVLKFRDDVGAECFKSVFGGCAAKRIQEKSFFDRMMYCMKARDECPGIASRFARLAPYLDRLSDDFFKSFIDPSSGWSNTLCENLVREIKKSDSTMVPDEVWQGVLNKMSAYQK